MVLTYANFQDWEFFLSYAIIHLIYFSNTYLDSYPSMIMISGVTDEYEEHPDQKS